MKTQWRKIEEIITTQMNSKRNVEGRKPKETIEENWTNR